MKTPYELHIEDLTKEQAMSLYAHFIGVPYTELYPQTGGPDPSFSGEMNLYRSNPEGRPFVTIGPKVLEKS